tara:strand:+ start:14739 stop:16082 length:1344 start_codon:yes stop_codon:yes gene_type:complete
MATTTTLSAILPKFGRRVGAYIGSFTTTTAIAANTSVVSTELTDLGFTDDDVLNDSFIKITSGNNLNDVRLISDYTASSGTITVTGTALTSDSSTQATFEIYRYDPDQLRDAINDAANQAFPALYKRIDDRTHTVAPGQARYARPSSIEPGYIRQVYIVPKIESKTFAENIINDQNCDMEASSSALTNWTDSANITAAVEADTTSPNNFMVYRGQRSAKLTCAASSTGTFTLSVTDPTNYESEELNFSIWVYSKYADLVSPMVQIDSDSVVTGTAHSGGGWQRLTVSTTSSNVGSTIKVGLSFASNGSIYTVYADEAILTSGPSEIPKGYESVVFDWTEEGDYLAFLTAPPSHYNLHIVGCGALETLTAGADTITLEPHRVNLLLDYAALTFFEGELDQTSAEDQNAILRQITHYRNKTQNGRGEMVAPSLKKNLLPAGNISSYGVV